MKYPVFLQNNDHIGITALSSGCAEENSVLEMKEALHNLQNYGFTLSLTDDIFGPEYVSGSIKTRIRQLEKLLEKDIKALLISRGGNLLYELLPYLDFSKIAKKNIWVLGYSDPTSLLYTLTTKYDIATIYGMNAKSFFGTLQEYQKNNLELLKGNLVVQKNYDNDLQSINGNFHDQGIIIGGCLDILRHLLGTEYDNTSNFLEKYKNYHIIWYFDIYSLSSLDVYLTLLQLKNSGWFKYSKTFLIGKVLFPNEDAELTYLDAYQKALFGNILYDTNIGHVKPCFSIINGSLATINYENKNLSIKQEILK